ncbi:MAG: HK97 family phage prohead protease [Beijerinckiaceae bacterium]
MVPSRTPVQWVNPDGRLPGDGLIEGYASLFGVTDMARDSVEPGAFSQSLARRGISGIRMLWQHDAAQPIGVWLSIREDSRGLFVRGRLNHAVERARDVYALVREGAVDGLSIGFKAERARTPARGAPRRLYAVDLWEISIVTFPMLPGARVHAVPRDAGLPDGQSAALAGAIRRATQSLLQPRTFS